MFHKRMRFAIPTITAVLGGILTASTPSQSAWSQEIRGTAYNGNPDISKEILDAREVITSAEIYSVPAGLSFRNGLREKDVVEFGCGYNITTREDLDAVFDLISRAQFRLRPEEKISYDMRTVIYLNDAEGRKAALTLTREYLNFPATGFYMSGVPIAATMGFGPSLMKWKKGRKSVQGTEMMCRD